MLLPDIQAPACDDRHELKTTTARPKTVPFMRVLESAVLRGPSRYSMIPVIRMRIDLGQLEHRPTNRLPGFKRRLLSLLPGLCEHGCCYQTRGGFVRRMAEGTWLGHVVEHVALELQWRAGADVSRGKTRSVSGQPGVYDVLFAYEEEATGLLAGRLALELVDSLLPPRLQGVQGIARICDASIQGDTPRARLTDGIEALRALRRRLALGPTTRSLVDEAKRRGIPVTRLDDASLVQLGTGRWQKRIRASMTSSTSQIASDAAGDKNLTKALLAQAEVPVPDGEIVRSAAAAVRAAERIGYPVVIKPLDGNHGRGVSIGIATAADVTRAYEAAAKISRRVIVEEHYVGSDFRILVVNGEAVAVAERVPAHVTGDGLSTVTTLIDRVNADPRRGEGHEKVMTRMSIDDHVRNLLAAQGLTLDSIPEEGRRVDLRDTANISTGGTAIDRTDDIHPFNALVAERAARIIGLDIAGIDMITPDITRPLYETGGGIVEVNASPGFRMHLQPSEGLPRNVAGPVLDMLFEPGKPVRIPIIAITGTNGKSTTARMVAHVFAQSGCHVGLTSTTGVYLNGQRILEADASGPKSARVVLRDPQTEIAILETARGGILREGLGFDACDVGIVTNIAADHLGIKGIETLEDLADIKSVVVEAVRPGGTSVLNADDPMVEAMRSIAGGRIAWFSMQSCKTWPDWLRRHCEQGGCIVSREGADLVLHEAGERHRVMAAADIPATLGGAVAFNIENALAAIAACHAQGVKIARIRAALASFTSSFEQCPGRLNIHDGHGFRVILDYAHNPAGLRALGAAVHNMRPHFGRVIGMVNIPGDRRDQDMEEMGALAAQFFDEIIFREDPARRGRKPGEIVELLARGARAAGFPEERLHQILDESEAAQACLDLARPGDLVVLTPTDVEPMWRQVLEYTSPERRHHPRAAE